MTVWFKIVASGNTLDYLILKCDRFHNETNLNHSIFKNKDNRGNLVKTNPKTIVKRKISLDGYCISAFAHLLKFSDVYKFCVINHFTTKYTTSPVEFVFIKLESINPKKHVLDYKWNERLNRLCGERCELESMMAWLSTLGGGFSCLGDTIESCSVIAGKISTRQFKIALRLGDPPTISRCRLYYAISLIQRGYLHDARKIIECEHDKITRGILIDNKLKRMCQGIWAKLKYEWSKKHKIQYNDDKNSAAPI